MLFMVKFGLVLAEILPSPYASGLKNTITYSCLKIK